MPKFLNARRYWPSAAFARSLKAEIETLSPDALPLGKAVTQGSHVGKDPIVASVLQVADEGETIEARLGVFFAEVVASCGCGTDPLEQNAYCEMRLRIDKATAEGRFEVLPD